MSESAFRQAEPAADDFHGRLRKSFDRLALDHDGVRAFDLAGVLLREFDHQNAGVVLALDFLGLYVAHVEGSLAGAGVALLTPLEAVMVR